MHEQNKAIVKALVTVAWADGVFDAREQEVLEALLEAFDATVEEAHELREYSKTRRTVDDVPITDLSFDDRRLLLHHAVLLSFADGDPSEAERVCIDQLVTKLRISEQEAREVREIATERAKRLLETTSS